MVYHKTVCRLKPCILVELGGQKSPTLRLKRQTSVCALLLAPLKKWSLSCFLKLAVFFSCLYLQNLAIWNFYPCRNKCMQKSAHGVKLWLICRRLKVIVWVENICAPCTLSLCLLIPFFYPEPEFIVILCGSWGYAASSAFLSLAS